MTDRPDTAAGDICLLRMTWESYVGTTLADTPLAERRQAHHAYHSGAYAMFALLDCLGALPPEERAPLVAALKGELDVFLHTRTSVVQGLV